MNVGVNLLWCRPGVVGGSEEYVVRQLLGLETVGFDTPVGLDTPVDGDDDDLDRDDLDRDDLDLTLFVLPSFAAAHPEVTDRFRTVVAPTSGRPRAVRVGVENTWLVAQSRHRALAITHHAGGTAPRLRGAPSVLTVHDLQYLTYAHFFSLTKLAYLRAAVPASVKHAVAITVPSVYVRAAVAEAFSYPTERIVVVPHGLDPSVGAAPIDAAEVRRRYGIDGPFVVYPAITHPHKNHETLLRAMAGVRRWHPDVRLVLLGGPGAADAAVTAEIERLGLVDIVVRPGRVPAADRDAIVTMAEVLAFPSLYEGFGAPALEAMALGAPVVAAAATALPEVVGDAGLLVDPYDVDGWAAAIGGLLDDDLERAVLATAGRQRAAGFTARRSADALLGAYRLALA